MLPEFHCRLRGKFGDTAANIELSLYADADFAGDGDDAKSTSGNFLVLTGPNNTYFPSTWSSTKQTSTSRSTTESEVVSLASRVFTEATPASYGHQFLTEISNLRSMRIAKQPLRL